IRLDTSGVEVEVTTGTGYKVWGTDQAIYGPVELPVLVGWVKDERVTPNTWVFSEKDERWARANTTAELRMFFAPKTSPAAAPVEAIDAAAAGIKPGWLRRVKIFADFSEPQPRRFCSFIGGLPLRS